MVSSLNSGMHSVLGGIHYYSTQACNRVSYLFSSVAHGAYSAYDFAYHRNPLTQSREIQTFPLLLLSNTLGCGCNDKSDSINESLDRLVKQVGGNIEKIAERKHLKFRVSSDNSSTWTCHKGHISISQNMLLHLEKIWLSRDPKYRDVSYEDLVANHIAHEVAHFNGLHIPKKLEKKVFFHVTAIKICQISLRILKMAILPSLLLLNMFFIISMEGIFNHKISSYTIGLLIAGIGMNLFLLGAANTAISFLFSFGLNLASGLVSDTLDQSCELEADQFAMHYLSKAGYNPRAMLCLAETEKNIQESHWKKIKNIVWHTFGLTDNHPTSEKRLENAKKTLIELKINDAPRYAGWFHWLRSWPIIESTFYNPVMQKKQ
jgi:hypothetical protein